MPGGRANLIGSSPLSSTQNLETTARSMVADRTEDCKSAGAYNVALEGDSMFSRRIFLGMAATSLLGSRISVAVDHVPDSLDHILLGCNDLQRGIDFVEQHTGVRAAFGGVHPGRGTQNALLSLGKLHYLEIIAPDPKQSEVKQFDVIMTLIEPALIGWAAHVHNIEALATRLKAVDIAIDGPTAGSRARPDGRMLKWQAFGIGNARTGVVPFFIEWSADSPHPSIDAPSGCKLTNFSVSSPRPEDLEKEFKMLGLDVEVTRADKPQLHATIVGPKGRLQLG